MSTPVLSDFDFGNVTRGVNVPNPVADTDMANLAIVKQLLANVPWKDDARFGATTNVNVASPGASVGGGSPSVGDRIFLQGQTAPAENGLWVWNGAAVPMTRPADFDAAAEVDGAMIKVREGTNAGTTWTLTTASPLTIGTTGLTFANMAGSAPNASETTAGLVELATQSEVDSGAASPTNLAVTPVTLANWSGRKLKNSTTFGDGTATQYDITHNFNTRDLVVLVYRVSDNKRVECDVTMNTVNAVRLNFAAAVASNALRAVILG